MKVTPIPVVISALELIPKKLEKRLDDQKKNRDYSDHSNAKTSKDN